MVKTRDMTQGGQFALIPASVLYNDQLPATAKLLYGEIYRLSHANGYCYASNRDFTELLQCSEKTVRRLIAALAEQGHIRVKMIRRYGDQGDITQRRIFCGQELAKEDPPDPAEDLPEGGDKNDRTPGQKCPDGPVKNVHHTTKSNIYINIPPIIPREIYAICETYAGEDGELLGAILGLLENRAKVNKSPVKTTRAMNGIFKKLDRLSGGGRELKLALLEKATVSNWLTVYPLKSDELPASGAAAYNEEGYDGI